MNKTSKKIIGYSIFVLVISILLSVLSIINSVPFWILAIRATLTFLLFAAVVIAINLIRN